jgi:hypothetical protein
MRHSVLKMMVLAGTVLLLAAGCAANRPRWPAISETPTDVHIQGRWVWGELLADTVEAEKTFYQGKAKMPTP